MSLRVDSAAAEAPANGRKATAVGGPLVAGTLAVVAFFYAAIALRRGPVMSPDSNTYSHWADLLLAAHFNYVAWSHNVDFVVPPLSYAGWVTVVALDKLFLGSAWQRGILGFNLGAAVVVAGMVLQLVRRLVPSRLAVFGAGLALLVAFELLLWIPYVLSDVSFMFLSFAVVYLLCIEHPSEGRISTLRFALCSLFALLGVCYRPDGLPLALVALAAISLGRPLKSSGIATRTIVARWTALGLCVLVAAIVVLDAALMRDPGRWPFPFLSGWIQHLSQEYRQGYVIVDRLETYHSTPSSLIDFVWLNIDRLRSFFAFSAAGFSRGHLIANLLFFVPVYVGWLFALVSLFWPGGRNSWKLWWTTAVGTLFVGVLCVFHSLQEIDYDWRYRLSCLPVLILLGVIGWHQIVDNLSALRRIQVTRKATRSSSPTAAHRVQTTS